MTTVFVPTKSNGTALLSYQIAYDSASVDASPSYSLNSVTDTKIEAALGRGWHVNVPDYEGPLASFTAGVMSGYATLDSVRAALSCREILRLSPNARYAMYGYSGGALGAGWAAELQSQYAPELKFSGAALRAYTKHTQCIGICGWEARGCADSTFDIGFDESVSGDARRVQQANQD